jgi:hypothetical protein
MSEWDANLPSESANFRGHPEQCAYRVFRLTAILIQLGSGATMQRTLVWSAVPLKQVCLKLEYESWLLCS